MKHYDPDLEDYTPESVEDVDMGCLVSVVLGVATLIMIIVLAIIS